MSAEFEHGATAREVLAYLEEVPEDERDLAFVVMFLPEGFDEWTPGVVTSLYAFPERTAEAEAQMGRLRPAVWTIAAVEGDTPAALVEALRAFREFEETGEYVPPPGPEEGRDR